MSLCVYFWPSRSKLRADRTKQLWSKQSDMWGWHRGERICSLGLAHTHVKFVLSCFRQKEICSIARCHSVQICYGSCDESKHSKGLAFTMSATRHTLEVLFFFFYVFTEEEDVAPVLRDKSHIDETLRLATEDKSGDYAGEDQGWFNRCDFVSWSLVLRMIKWYLIDKACWSCRMLWFPLTPFTMRKDEYVKDVMRDPYRRSFILRSIGQKRPRTTWAWLLKTTNLCLFFKTFHLHLQQLCRDCGRSTTRPSSQWSRPTSTTSWGSTRSQVPRGGMGCVCSVLVGLLWWLMCRLVFYTSQTSSSHHYSTVVTSPAFAL